MNHNRSFNNHIIGIHKRALSLVYNDFSSSFSELLEKDKSDRNLQTLAYEIFEVKNKMAPEILTQIFLQKESNYILRNSTALQGGSIKNVMDGSETISRISVSYLYVHILFCKMKCFKHIKESAEALIYYRYCAHRYIFCCLKFCLIEIFLEVLVMYCLERQT